MIPGERPELDKLTSSESAELAKVTLRRWLRYGPLPDGWIDGRAHYWLRATVIRAGPGLRVTRKGGDKTPPE